MERLLAGLVVAATLGVILLMSRLLVRRRFDVMFLTLLLLGFWFVFRPAHIVLGLDGPTPDYLFPEGAFGLIVAAEATALLWLGAFMAGALAADVAGAPARAIFPRLEGEPNPMFVFFGLITVTLLGCFVTAWLFSNAGGTLTDTFRLVKGEKGVTGYYFLRQFAVMGELLSAFALFYFVYLNRARMMPVPHWWALVAIICFAINAFSIYAWGHRYSVAMATMALVAGYNYFVRRLSWAELLSFAILFLAVFIGLRLFRDALFFEPDVLTPVSEGNVWRKMAVAMHGSQFDALMLAIRDVDLSSGLRWGEDFLAGFAAMIPRQIWPDRPIFNIGHWFRQMYEPHTQNGWPITPVGEWLVNFGWIGVAIGGALSGYLLRAAQTVYDDLWRNPWSLMMCVTVALFVAPGGISVGSPQALVALILPLFLTSLAMRQLSPLRRAWG